MSIFDSHAHLSHARFDGDRDELIHKLFEADVCGVLECATCPEDIASVLALARRYERIYAAIGVHPHSASEYTDATEAALSEGAKFKKTVAIGEIGLDYHYDYSPRDVQREVLVRQLRLARELGLPVVLHSREATQDMLDILKAERVSCGVMHCFSGSAETAREVLDMGLYIGIGGSLTFKNAQKPVEVARMLPLDRLLLETDCPYMTPEPHRHDRNDARYIAIVAERIADIKGVARESIEQAAKENAKKLFGIGDML